MSELVIPPGYGRVVGRVLRAVTVETGPAPLVGARVTVRPSVARVTRDGDPVPLIVGDEIECTLDDNGFLLGPDGEQGVLLVATDADTRPAGWHWLVRVSAPSVASYQWQVLVPEGVTTDMVAATSDPAVSGLPLLEWRGILTEVWEAHADVMSAAGAVDHDRQWTTAARAGAEQAADRAETASSQAVTAQGAAEKSADTAETYANQAASSAQDAASLEASALAHKSAAASSAQAAEGGAQDAEAAAAAAANSAGSAFDDAAIAQGARLGAEAARDAAEAAADTAETAAGVAVTAKTLAEGFAGDAETARDATLIAAAGVAQHGRIQYDAATGRYTNDSIEGFFASRATPYSYGVSIPKGLATACAKTGTNAGIPTPTPSTIAQPGSDPYTAHTPFFTLEVNGGVEEDGTPYVTAVQGDARFKRDGSNGDVWIMTPVLYWRMEEEDEAVELQVSDSPLAGFTVQPKGLLPSGARRPYMLYAKYAMSMTGTTPRSISGGLVRTRDVSHNTLRTITKATTTGYSGMSFADEWYVKVMFMLKYATKNSQSVFAGHTGYSAQIAPAAGETGVKRVLVTNAQAANILVGSTWSLGNGGSNDRGNAATHDIFESARVVSKQEVGGQTSIVFDTASPFNTATSQLLSVMPWRTGACDDVPGDGSPYDPKSGAEPFTIQGIEKGYGAYEVAGDVILWNDGESGWVPYLVADSQLSSTAVTANYAPAGPPLPAGSGDTFNYPTYPVPGSGLLYGADKGASTSTGLCDRLYTSDETTAGTREWLAFGGLSDGALAGLWGVLGGYSLALGAWVIASRLSAVGRGGETP